MKLGLSRINLHWHDGEDGVLIATAYHYSQHVVSLDGGADVSCCRNSLAVDGDYDIVVFKPTTGGLRGGKKRLFVEMYINY